MNTIESFLNETSQVTNAGLFVVAIAGIVLGLTLADLADALRVRRQRKAREVAR